MSGQRNVFYSQAVFPSIRSLDIACRNKIESMKKRMHSSFSDFLGLFPSKSETVCTQLTERSARVVMPLTALHLFLPPLVTMSIHFVPGHRAPGLFLPSRGKTISLFRGELLNKKYLPSCRRSAAARPPEL